MLEPALVTGATGNNTKRWPSTWVLADECQEAWRLPLFAQPRVFQGLAEARQSQPMIHDTRLPQQRASHHLSVSDMVSVPPVLFVLPAEGRAGWQPSEEGQMSWGMGKGENS